MGYTWFKKIRRHYLHVLQENLNISKSLLQTKSDVEEIYLSHINGEMFFVEQQNVFDTLRMSNDRT